MPSISFDVALGREVELYNRVNSNDPTNSALIMLVLASGHEADALLRTYATISAMLAGDNDEVTNTGYARKTLTDADLAAYTVDTTLHRIVLPLPTQTFSSIDPGDSWSKLVVAYDNDTTSGTDADLVPVGAIDLRYQGSPVAPNNNDIIVAFSNGLLIAS
jgi:hypothetical protein